MFWIFFRFDKFDTTEYYNDSSRTEGRVDWQLPQIYMHS